MNLYCQASPENTEFEIITYRHPYLEHNLSYDTLIDKTNKLIEIDALLKEGKADTLPEWKMIENDKYLTDMEAHMLCKVD